MRPAPLITQDLLDYLKETFPDKCPATNVPMDEVRALAGEQRVIAHLNKQFRDQDRKSLRGGGSAVVLNNSPRQE